MNFVIRLIISTLAVLITSYVLPGVYLDSFTTAILVAVVLGCLNALVKPLLILFSLPMVIFTFGLFLIVINTLIILLADALITGFKVNGFWWALAFSVVLSLVTGILNGIKSRDEEAN
jgi:putative membrane protein